MKKLLNMIFLAGLIACQQNTSSKQQEPAVAGDDVEKKYSSFDWLLTNWVRINEKAGRKTFERWHKQNDGNYSGWGYTLAGKDTVFQEHMNLIRTADKWQLEVKSPEDELATVFKMSQHTDSSFTVENAQHDFPTKILYFIQSDTLKAEVSNAEMSIAFDFIPIR